MTHGSQRGRRNLARGCAPAACNNRRCVLVSAGSVPARKALSRNALRACTRGRAGRGQYRRAVDPRAEAKQRSSRSPLGRASESGACSLQRRAVRHKFGVAARCRCTLTSEKHACRSARLYAACGVPHTPHEGPTWHRARTCLLGWRGRARRAHDERRGRGGLGWPTRLCAGARREQRCQVRNLIPEGEITLGQLVDPRRLLAVA